MWWSVVAWCSWYSKYVHIFKIKSIKSVSSNLCLNQQLLKVFIIYPFLKRNRDKNAPKCFLFWRRRQWPKNQRPLYLFVAFSFATMTRTMMITCNDYFLFLSCFSCFLSLSFLRFQKNCCGAAGHWLFVRQCHHWHHH